MLDKAEYSAFESTLNSYRIVSYRITIKHRSPDLMVRLYKSLVRPHLEYSSPVWNPHYRKDKLLLESFQHRFTRLFEDLKNLPYFDRLNKLKLGLWSLEKRRNRVDLIKLFKMVRGFSSVPLQTYFQLADGNTLMATDRNWLKLRLHAMQTLPQYARSASICNAACCRGSAYFGCP